MVLSDRRKLEFFLVAIIFSTLVFIAAGRYSELAKETQILRLKVISEHFITSAVYLRIEYLVSKTSATQTTDERGVMVEGKLIYVSEGGWPASSRSPVRENFHPADADCYELWQVLLQNPASIAIGKFASTREEYRAYANGESCRYTIANGTFYFDYFPLTGERTYGPVVNK